MGFFLQYIYIILSSTLQANQMGSNKVELNVAKVENCLELENGQMTPDSVLELPVLTRTSSSESSSSSAGVPNLTRTTTPLGCAAATTEFVKRKRSSVFVSRNRCQPTRSTAAAEPIGATSRRRKGVPHRSPLYWVSGIDKDVFGRIFYDWWQAASFCYYSILLLHGDLDSRSPVANPIDDLIYTVRFILFRQGLRGGEEFVSF